VQAHCPRAQGTKKKKDLKREGEGVKASSKIQPPEEHIKGKRESAGGKEYPQKKQRGEKVGRGGRWNRVFLGSSWDENSIESSKRFAK